MKLSRHASLITLFLLAFPPVAIAQNQTWIRQFGSAAFEAPTSAASDGAGGVFVSGGTDGNLSGPNLGEFDIWLARYDGAGDQLWIHQFGTTEFDRPLAATPDGLGGVFVGGLTAGSLGGPSAGGADAWLARHDSTGTQLWIRQVGTGATDFVAAVAQDGTGGVFVSGDTGASLWGPNLGSRDSWLARYDSGGNQVWSHQFGTDRADWVIAAAPDNSGGVYVGGRTGGSLFGPNVGFNDAWLARFDSAGSRIWARQLGTSTGDEYVTAATPDGSGGVIVSGGAFGNLGGPHAGDYDAWVARYDSHGNRLWIRQLGTSGTDLAGAAAPDGSSGVYLGGWTTGSLGGPSSGGVDAWIAHYDSAGIQRWIHQSGTQAVDDLHALVPSSSGGVFVSGSTEGSLGGPNAGLLDVWLGRYEPDLVTIRYCSPAANNSTTQPAEIRASGSNTAANNDLMLHAEQLPPNQVGYFLSSTTRGFSAMPGSSQGNLCLSGSIGRYDPAAGFPVQNSGAAGIISVTIDLAATPTPTGFTAILAGQIWNFQAWYRDGNPTPTSNFTDAVSVTFQ